ncbi:uncharacterized protein TEOVI_000719100 [Trypanosoma equiperdum]|uniref:Uncharacterized protein n=3 Tax=Trypanozoon TaxID=39700 RepID=Q382K6_TRYB2|nr:hypothetical protein, conserved [Trypanosoma brucei gambiense DAL972]XP_829387.1 hypothetical protein, conserved [Trypanosoma brucei brucei TREU927]EAN80275.1 hypothetical protein, conserved [Trypanosoma brucei brucei TREU927]CBH18365.1 hypothetical protein, conserved [Trypanosoma brucei gambiense DAL972]SCU66304.1 hypothetical protein, conserved [Trypanosoma equiperdum]|eukprot:XP_011780629.1 hypothetical protein, conserved [Trypanosoma brucei gambiense DAL972]
MAKVSIDPVYLTFRNDDASMAPSCLIDGDPTTFILTTGGFPQDIIFSVGSVASANISGVALTLHDAKDVLVERCTSALPTNFDVISKLSLPRTGGNEKQRERITVDPTGDGKAVRYLRLRILSGYNQFVGIFEVEVEGEESQQRIAVLESNPEVVM